MHEGHSEIKKEMQMVTGLCIVMVYSDEAQFRDGMNACKETDSL